MGKYAIILVSALIFTAATYSYSLMNNERVSSERTVENFSYNQANNIAQSALMIAVRDLMDNPNSSFVPSAGQLITYPQGNSFAAWEDVQGEYRLVFENLGDTLLSVESIGRFNGLDYSASVGLTFSSSGGTFNWPTLNQALHTDGSIGLTGSSRIYGDVSTNSTLDNDVTFGWSTWIYGNLAVGPGADPELVAPRISQWAPNNVTGDKSALPQEINFDLPTFPDMPASISAGQSMRVTTWHEEQMQTQFHHSEFDGILIEELAIAGNRTMTLDVGSGDRVLHVRNINISQGHLNIVGDGNLTIYVEDGFTLGGGSTFNYSGEPENLMIFYDGNNRINFGGNIRLNSNMYVNKADIAVGGSNEIRGNIISGGNNVTISGNAGSNSRVFYAPNAHVVLNGSGRVYGSVVAKSFRAEGNTFIEYQHGTDVDMPEIDDDSGSGAASYAIVYWK